MLLILLILLFILLYILQGIKLKRLKAKLKEQNQGPRVLYTSAGAGKPETISNSELWDNIINDNYRLHDLPNPVVSMFAIPDHWKGQGFYGKSEIETMRETMGVSEHLLGTKMGRAYSVRVVKPEPLKIRTGIHMGDFDFESYGDHFKHNHEMDRLRYATSVKCSFEMKKVTKHQLHIITGQHVNRKDYEGMLKPELKKRPERKKQYIKALYLTCCVKYRYNHKWFNDPRHIRW